MQVTAAFARSQFNTSNGPRTLFLVLLSVDFKTIITVPYPILITSWAPSRSQSCDKKDHQVSLMVHCRGGPQCTHFSF